MLAKLLIAAGLLPVIIPLTGCASDARRSAADTTGGNLDHGAQAIVSYGCGSCHTVPGIPGAHGLVGPSLAGVRARVYVAGILPNDPSNVEHWIEDPHSIIRDTVMPNLGVSQNDATDITAYLYSLQ